MEVGEGIYVHGTHVENTVRLLGPEVLDHKVTLLLQFQCRRW